MTLVHSFPGTEPATLEEVGGKGLSLIRMTESGFPVPPGVVLTASFFAPWLEEIQASAAWAAVAESPREKWGTLCDDLKQLCTALSPTERQQQALEQVRKELAQPGDRALFAVRSSSPEEDLASASFAGGYETRLGVRLEDLEDALRHCFAGSFDERVLVYKQEHGFDVLAPRFAVVVQRQIDSEVAGVGFSLNLRTNDYDEAVIAANWGLGESVVAGRVSPDHFVVDKVAGRVLEKKLGTKEVSVWLGPNGGTVEREDHRVAELSLDDAQLGELTDAMCRIEALYDEPIDIEWAYAGGRLHVLQARPITTHVPLPPEMLTKPGERRHLYLDAALQDGLTINGPISPMGLDWMEDATSCFVEPYIGAVDLNPPPQHGLMFFAGARTYANLSNTMWLRSAKSMAKEASYLNALMGEVLANVDEKQYRSIPKPSYLRFWRLRWLPKALWHSRSFLWNTLRMMLSPERNYGAYRRTVDAYEVELTKNVDYDLPLAEFRTRYAERMARVVMDFTFPALIAWMILGVFVLDFAFRNASVDVKALVDKLKRGFTGNVVIEMGIALFRLAKLLDRADLDDVAGLGTRIERREMSPEFLEAWDAFLEKYGCRGPLEMDLASPRYADDPALALGQMSFMVVDDEGFDPEVAHLHNVEERRRAYEELVKSSGWLRRRMLRRAHRIIECYAGCRDDPKYHLVLFGHAVRRRLLMEARSLVRDGRLDDPEHVFDLQFQDLEAAAEDPSLDLRALREERTRFLRKLEAQVREFPALIDSRGRILRPPPREERPGELRGLGVSPGVVTGPVKVLHDPREKRVERGDVLVAYTTDPGWTPLFVNAAAVLLEVGGLLQHGAVVAREYGKPCVAGIDGLMTKLEDGQTVEVDGTEGLVRLLT